MPCGTFIAKHVPRMNLENAVQPCEITRAFPHSGSMVASTVSSNILLFAELLPYSCPPDFSFLHVFFNAVLLILWRFHLTLFNRLQQFQRS
jgi:hypothetical protein